MKLHGLVPNFHIHVFVSDLNIPSISPPIFCSKTGWPIVGIFKSLTETWMWKVGARPRSFISWNICFEFSVQCLCSVGAKKIVFVSKRIEENYRTCRLFIYSTQYNRGISLDFFMYVICSTLLILPPLRFHCWDRTQDSCDTMHPLYIHFQTDSNSSSKPTVPPSVRWCRHRARYW